MVILGENLKFLGFWGLGFSVENLMDLWLDWWNLKVYGGDRGLFSVGLMDCCVFEVVNGGFG
jgi:hypothetical protein